MHCFVLKICSLLFLTSFSSHKEYSLVNTISYCPWEILKMGKGAFLHYCVELCLEWTKLIMYSLEKDYEYFKTFFIVVSDIFRTLSWMKIICWASNCQKQCNMNKHVHKFIREKSILEFWEWIKRIYLYRVEMFEGRLLDI